MQRFSETFGSCLLDDPLWTTPKTDWIGHIPFVFFLIEKMRPAVAVELGVFYGDSFSAMCQAAKKAGTGTRLIGIDSWEGDIHTGKYTEEVYQNLKAHHDGHYPGISELMRCYFDDALAAFEEESVDLLHIDGMHTYDAVSHDLETWLPKVKPGGLVLFHDINVRDQDEFGVWKRWEEIEPDYPERHGFSHCNGLGVIRKPGGAAGDLPEVLTTLLSQSEDSAWLDRLFSDLGERIMRRWEVGVLETRVEIRENKLENFRGMVERRDKKIETLKRKLGKD